MFILKNKLALVVFFFMMIYPASGSGDDAGLDAGVRLFKARRYAEARTFFEEHVRAFPDDARSYDYLGRICLIQDELKDAVRWLEKAVALSPDGAEYHYQLSLAYGQQAQRAGILKKPGLAKKMKATVEKAIALDPDHIDARWILMQFHMYAPGIMGGDRDEAFHQAEEIKRRNIIQGHRAYATLYDRYKQYDKAEKEYQDAIAEEPDSLIHYYDLQNWYGTRKRYQDAVAVNETILQKDSTAVNARYNIGYWQHQAGRIDEAFTAYETILATGNQQANAHYQIGKLGAVTGRRLNEAKQHLEAFLQLETEDETFIAWAHYRLGMIHERLGDTESARASYQKALQVKPDLREAMDALKKIR